MCIWIVNYQLTNSLYTWECKLGCNIRTFSASSFSPHANIILKNILIYFYIVLWKKNVYMIDIFRASWSKNIVLPLLVLFTYTRSIRIEGGVEGIVHEWPSGRVPTSCQQLINRSGPSRGKRGPRKRRILVVFFFLFRADYFFRYYQ